MQAESIAQEFERLRPKLTSYLMRLVVRADLAEDLAQTTALRALEATERAPRTATELRPWLFRIATNLAIDERRRHGPLRKDLLFDARKAAETSAPWFREESESWRGSPETAAIAREHLVACFSCTLGQLPPEHAAALLLKEVYDFTTEGVADILGARFGQVKNWLQAARATMEAKYAETCALIRKQGVCYQCVELDGHFGANRGDPLEGTNGDLDARLRVLRELRDEGPARWHVLLTRLLKTLD